jgi:hypothetical protein
VSDRRLTYLLRPNVRQPDHRIIVTIDTPPATDLDNNSHIDSDSDAPSDTNEEHVEGPLVEENIKFPHSLSSSLNSEQHAWSVIGPSDSDRDEVGGGPSITEDIGRLAIASETTKTNMIYLRARQSLRTSRARSTTSSPSRSPMRSSTRRPRAKGRKQHQVSREADLSFFDFLYR